MSEVSRQRNGELMQGVMSILSAFPDGLHANELLQKLEGLVPPTPFEDSDYENRPGIRRRERIVRFASISFVKAGWLRKHRGIWSATDAGLIAFRQFQDPLELAREASRLYRVWKKSRPREEAEDAEDLEGTDSALTLEEAEEAAWDEIRRYLMAMPPYDFQDLIAVLLGAMGYHVSYVSPPGPDRGLDILANTDPLGAVGPRIKVQVKRRAEKTTVEGVRSFMSLLSNQDVGLFISTGGFTSEAEREARHQESRRITLIDVDRLFELWVDNYARVPESGKRLLPLRQIAFLDPRT